MALFEDERKLRVTIMLTREQRDESGQLGQASGRRGVPVKSRARRVDRRHSTGSPQADRGRSVTAELIAIIALGGLLTPILLAMNGRMNAVADRLQTLGERVAKVERSSKWRYAAVVPRRSARGPGGTGALATRRQEGAKIWAPGPFAVPPWAGRRAQRRTADFIPRPHPYPHLHPVSSERSAGASRRSISPSIDSARITLPHLCEHDLAHLRLGCLVGTRRGHHPALFDHRGRLQRRPGTAGSGAAEPGRLPVAPPAPRPALGVARRRRPTRGDALQSAPHRFMPARPRLARRGSKGAGWTSAMG